MSEQESPRHIPQVFINYAEPIAKSPPLLETGALAWIRKNLFGSLLDTLLTVIGFLLILGVVIGFTGWIISQADWFALRFTLQQFITGSMPNDEIWRVSAVILLVGLTAGSLVAAFSRRIAPIVPFLLGAIVALVLLLPIIVNTVVPLPTITLVAGSMEIVSGTATEKPIPRTAFIARGGEQVTLQFSPFVPVVDDTVQIERSVASISGFIDRATNALRNGADNRLINIARVAELIRLIREDIVLRADKGYGVLHPNQQMWYRDELARIFYAPAGTDPAVVTDLKAILTNTKKDAAGVAVVLRNADVLGALDTIAGYGEPPLIHETYQLNTQAVTLQLFNANNEPLGEPQTLAPDGTVTFDIPADGWYILSKTIESETPAVTLLAIKGIYPIFYDAALKNYQRSSDLFILTENPPQEGTRNMPYVTVLEYKYRGDRSLNDYLRIYLSPFLEIIRGAVVGAILAVVVGFIGARTADRFLSPRDVPFMYSRRVATWLLIASPILIFGLINFSLTAPFLLDPDGRWGGLVLALMITIFGVIFAFPLGIALALGRRSQLPVVSTLCTVVIELVRGTPYIVVLFAGQLLIPLLSPAFGDIANVYRALGATIIFIAAYLAENVRGGLQSIPAGQEEAARALGLSGWHITLFITLPQALRAVIPALVGQFISLFKDTSLLVIVGLFDLNNAVNTMIARQEFNNARREGLIFITFIYFVVSYVMAYVSRRIEESGSGAARRI